MPISHFVEWRSILSFPLSPHSEPALVQTSSVRARSRKALRFRFSPSQALSSFSKHSLVKVRLSPNSASRSGESSALYNEDGDDDDDDDDNEESGADELRDEVECVEIKVEKTGNNRRRIQSKIAVEADLETLWDVLTDYERLAEFIPGLAVCRLLLKRDNFARLFQIGEQDLVLGLKFSAKGIVDCYEKDLQSLPVGQRRDIEFKMIEGDFQLFEGKWSIEQLNKRSFEKVDHFLGKEFNTILSYVVDVEPKLWLPVHLVEGRICREIKMNLTCIRDEAQKAYLTSLPDC